MIGKTNVCFSDDFNEVAKDKRKYPNGFEKLSATEKELHELSPEALLKYRILSMHRIEITEGRNH